MAAPIAGAAGRPIARALATLGVTLGMVLAALLLMAPAVLADTASNPPASEASNNLILGIVALAALSAVLILTRPRRGPR